MANRTSNRVARLELITLRAAKSDPDPDSISTHLPNPSGTDYATLCGIATDGDDDSGVPIDAPGHNRVTCPDCYAAWLMCRQYSAKYF